MVWLIERIRRHRGAFVAFSIFNFDIKQKQKLILTKTLLPLQCFSNSNLELEF